MKITIIAVGKLKEKYLKDGIAEYTKRLSRFADVEMVEVEDENAPDTLSAAQEQQVKKKEGERILRKVKPGSLVAVLDLKGDQPDSEGFAAKIRDFMIGGTSHITFIIGGSLGLDTEVLRAAQYRLCLSNMTFPHQLARLILLEQAYRAFKIMNGETYHK